LPRLKLPRLKLVRRIQVKLRRFVRWLLADCIMESDQQSAAPHVFQPSGLWQPCDCNLPVSGLDFSNVQSQLVSQGIVHQESDGIGCASGGIVSLEERERFRAELAELRRQNLTLDLLNQKLQEQVNELLGLAYFPKESDANNFQMGTCSDPNCQDCQKLKVMVRITLVTRSQQQIDLALIGDSRRELGMLLGRLKLALKPQEMEVRP